AKVNRRFESSRRLYRQVERRLGGRNRMRQPLSVKPRKIGARRNGDSASLGLLFIRKDRTSSLRCRPARSAPRGRAGRLLLPNQCPCAPPAGFNLPHPHSDGRFALAQLATDLVLIYPAKDRQKKPPSGFVALATHTGDHVPPILTGSASAFARWQPP